jgi:hypothetical protein
MRNTSQQVQKSLPSLEGITLDVVKDVTGNELDNVLKGIGAFTKSFKQDDRYMVTIHIEKSVGKASGESL